MIMVGKQFILYQLRFQLFFLLLIELKKVEEVKNLYYLFEEKLYQELLILMELINFQILQL